MHLMFDRKGYILNALASVLLLLPLFFYIWRIGLRPPRISSQEVLFAGITYKKDIYERPRPYIVHIVTIDLQTPKLKVLVTPPKYAANSSRNPALTTSQFLDKYQLQIAINGSFFYPFRERTPWNYYPRTKEAANVLGESISRKQRYGKKDKTWNVICLEKNNLAVILPREQCPSKTFTGIAGRKILVLDGSSQINFSSEPYGRTAVATNKQGNKLWLIVVDGKQPFYSEGTTLAELSEIAIDLGADRALNLDGGGSTTLVINDGDRTRILNAPIHNKIPMNERPVANHLGFAIER